MVRYENLLLACLLGSATARRESQHSDNGRLNCGIFGSGLKSNVYEMQIELQEGKLANKMFTIKAGKCDRVHCDDTTGIYVCNDGKQDVQLKGAWIAKGVKCIYDHCCTNAQGGWHYENGVSGQYFISGLGVNVNIAVGYGNNRDPPSIRPSNAGGWGLNGVCRGGVLNPASVICEV